MLTLLFLIACTTETPEAPPAPAPSTEAAPPSEAPDAEAEAEAVARAEAAMKSLGKTLKGRLVKAMGSDGPAAAVEVCNAEAQGLTAQVAKDSGVRVGRTSSKLRNPENAPKDWVTPWLEANAGKKAADVEGTHEVVDGVVRVIRPIGVEAPCLACHGAELAPEVQAKIAEKYPNDQATGYAVGDLRGAFWAEVPLGG